MYCRLKFELGIYLENSLKMKISLSVVMCFILGMNVGVLVCDAKRGYGTAYSGPFEVRVQLLGECHRMQWL